MAVLYRKYRPQNFSQVKGQAVITQTLKNAVSTERIAHAYLFTGGRGVGKTSLARILAKAVNCTQRKDGEPCLSCTMCLAIDQNHFMDLVEIDAASNTGIDTIRDLIEHVQFRPSQGKFKVFIIDEVHMLSKGAFNALLKTLEEPPEHALFILATTEIHKVPATIISRAQRFDFQKLSVEEITQNINEILAQESQLLEPEIIALVAERAEGGMRDALSILEKLIHLGSKIDISQARTLLGATDEALSRRLLELILEGSTADIPGFLSDVLASGVDCNSYIQDILHFLRITLVAAVTKTTRPTSASIARAGVPDLLFLIRLFLRAYKDQETAPSPDLAILAAAIEGALKFNTAVAAGTPPKQPSLTVLETAPKTQRAASPDLLEKKQTVTPFVSFVSEVSGAVVDTISLPELVLLWPQVIAAIKILNSPLATLVKNSPVQEIRGSTVVLGVKYLFHKENLESTKNVRIIQDALAQVTGKRLGVCGEVVKTEPLHTETTTVLQDALQVFGGELVE